MKFGAIFPSSEIGDDPVVIRDWAQAADALGYSHINFYDHVIGVEHNDRATMSPYTDKDPFHEPFVLMSYLAAVTSKIGLSTGVMQLPLRQTVLVAKQAAELALLSEGRLRLGVGTGSNYVEYECLGAPFKERGRVLDEQVELMRKLWDGGVVDFSGDFHRVDRAAILPGPPAQIPIWFGGRGPAALRRAAAVGDGFILSPAAWDETKEVCLTLTEALEANGRREGFGMEILTGFGFGPDLWHSQIETWEALGADYLSMRTQTTSTLLFGEPDPGFTKPQQHIDALETFMREVS